MPTRILIVDDHALVLAALRNTLQRHGTVWTATTVDEALRVAETTPLDVVVTDLELEDPDDRNGAWLLDQMNARWGLPGLLLTGNHETLGARVLHKPVSATKLRRAIEGLLRPPSG